VVQADPVLDERLIFMLWRAALDANRRATVRVEVCAQPETISDYSALGALVGQQTRKAVPYFQGLALDAADPLR